VTADPTREDYIAALRAIADFFEATPDLPMPKYTASLSGSLGLVEGGGVAAIEQAAAAMGVPSETLVSGENIHHRAERTFGPIELGWSFVEFGAAKSIPGEGEEVAGPAVGSGSATASAETGAQVARLEEVGGSGSGQGQAEPPTVYAESAAGVTDPPADGEPEAVRLDDGGTPAAVPAPVASGDGAAVTPDVWVARRRRDIAYHQVAVADVFTVCGRVARANGQRLTRAEAEAFGAVPCDRCYGTEG